MKRTTSHERDRDPSGEPLEEGGVDQLEEMAAEFTTEELREFLEGDLLDSEADPDFKESLRRRLWEMLKAGLVENSGND